MPRVPSRSKHVALLFLLAWSLRLIAGFAWQAQLPAGEQFGFGDSDGYWQLAHALSAGEDYQYGGSDARVFRMPGYPLLLFLWLQSALKATQ